MTKQEILALLNSGRKLCEVIPEIVTSGQTFSMVNTTKDKLLRKWNARLNVQKNLKGVGSKYNLAERNHLRVWGVNENRSDPRSNGYRTLNCNTLIEFRYQKQSYVLIDGYWNFKNQ